MFWIGVIGGVFKLLDIKNGIMLVWEWIFYAISVDGGALVFLK
jgi:hypothetical protein